MRLVPSLRKSPHVKSSVLRSLPATGRSAVGAGLGHANVATSDAEVSRARVWEIMAKLG